MSVEKRVKLRHDLPLDGPENVSERPSDQQVTTLGHGADRYVLFGARAHFHFRLLQCLRVLGYGEFPYYCAILERAEPEPMAHDGDGHIADCNISNQVRGYGDDFVLVRHVKVVQPPK